MPTPAEPQGSPTPDSASRTALIDKLFREHNHSLVRFLATRLASEQEAREVAQEAYVRLLQLDQPGAIGFLRAFLFKTAVNIATDRLRHRQIVTSTSRREWFDLAINAPLDTQLAAQQEVAVIESALTELPPRCREAFLLSRLGGIGTREIARRMRVTERMVRLYLAKAILHCRERLDEAHSLRKEPKS